MTKRRMMNGIISHSEIASEIGRRYGDVLREEEADKEDNIKVNGTSCKDRKVVGIGSSLGIVIPVEIIRQLGLTKGDTISIRLFKPVNEDDN